MNNLDLESVIEDSMDAALPEEPVVQEPSEDTPVEPVEAAVAELPEAEGPTPVKAEEAPTQAQDDFSKRFGIPAESSAGRENRIPYKRVKKIVERSQKEALEARNKEIEKTHIPITKYQETETKLKDYETRFSQVAEFENIMMNDAPRFLDMLTKIPAYANIFKALIEGQAKPQQQQQTEQVASEDPDKDFPQPDQQLPDGSMVYSLEGLKKLRAYDRRLATTEAVKAIEARYAPLEKDYQRFQQTQAVLPQIQAQIAEARTWPMFNESEAEIVKVLNQYPQVSLERAYQYVVLPKIQAEQKRLLSEQEHLKEQTKISKESVRAEVLAELKKAPRSTSVGSNAVKPNVAAPTGPRSLEDVIREATLGIGK